MSSQKYYRRCDSYTESQLSYLIGTDNLLKKNQSYLNNNLKDCTLTWHAPHKVRTTKNHLASLNFWQNANCNFPQPQGPLPSSTSGWSRGVLPLAATSSLPLEPAILCSAESDFVLFPCVPASTISESENVLGCTADFKILRSPIANYIQQTLYLTRKEICSCFEHRDTQFHFFLANSRSF